METTEQVCELLNDLLKINNDRIAGYQRAIGETKNLDIDLKALFEGMIKESEQYKTELAQLIGKYGGTIEDDTTTSGKIYRAWMDVKATFTGSDRKAILASCEFGEDAAQRAYESALATDLPLDEECRTLIVEQQQALKNSHDVIKKTLEAHTAL
ncbi:MAG: PA2169 family four-helix-bundle protein [Bacteroidetes bacterium]|nr:PA2169 family four-helix-bundle protein [Bacteroidota bacterium]